MYCGQVQPPMTHVQTNNRMGRGLSIFIPDVEMGSEFLANMTDDREVPFIIFEDSFPAPQLGQVGGKALNLWRLSNEYSCNVPKWICVTTSSFQHFIKVLVEV